MNKEYSAGAIIYRKEKGRTLFLLICGKRHGNWGFPKGHIEPGESEHDAALREIEEETGLTEFTPLDGLRAEAIYGTVSNRGPYKGRPIEKHAIYFLFETKESAVEVDRTEISEHKWVEMDEALDLLSFDVLKGHLLSADAFLGKKRSAS